MNLVFGLLVLGTASAAVWAGFADPEGGILGGIRSVLAGEPISKHVSTTAAAFVNSVSMTPAGVGGVPVVGATGGAGNITPGPAIPVNPGPVAPTSGARAAVIAEARTWLGVPYRYGGNTRAGVDCSGYTRAVFKKAAGITLPRVSLLQAAAGKATTLARAQPGDLICFGAPVHHVGIYLGGGNIIHAPHTGTVVRVEAIWHERIVVRNVLG